MKIAITGSAGFIGSHLVPDLYKKGYDIFEISRKKGYDIGNWSEVESIKKCDALVHLAAMTFVPESFKNPVDFLGVNYLTTLHTLELARKWEVPVVYMSSYFYGPPKYVPVDESHPINPHNPYAQSKYLSEELCRGYHRDFGVDVTVYRLFNIYGPNQKGSFLIPEILQKIQTGQLSLKDPRPKRDYIHVFDVVGAIETAILTPFKGFRVFNLGTGRSYSVGELVNMIQEASPIKFEVDFTHEYRKGEVLDSVADISYIKKELGWEPKFSLEKGLETLF